jgi:hypothetical protein
LPSRKPRGNLRSLSFEERRSHGMVALWVLSRRTPRSGRLPACAGRWPRSRSPCSPPTRSARASCSPPSRRPEPGPAGSLSVWSATLGPAAASRRDTQSSLPSRRSGSRLSLPRSRCTPAAGPPPYASPRCSAARLATCPTGSSAPPASVVAAWSTGFTSAPAAGRWTSRTWRSSSACSARSSRSSQAAACARPARPRRPAPQRTTAAAYPGLTRPTVSARGGLADKAIRGSRFPCQTRIV